MTPLPLLFCGRLSDVSAETFALLLDRKPRDDPGLASAVAAIITNVRTRGDAALREMAERFDGAELQTLEVPPARWEDALTGLDPAVRAGLERAAANVRRFHEAQVPADVTVEIEPGVTISRVSVPLERVGVYAPGGRAAYPSSVLMGVVPAKAAGVGEVVLCSPPDPSGLPSEEVMAAAAIAEADRLFTLGGAGAIAALAFGTESVAAVDAIVGPGNRWVTEAKRQVAGHLVIDSPAGPSEVLVVADTSAYARVVTLELIAQAEHDPDAACVLVTPSESLALAVEEELITMVPEAARADIVRKALMATGAILITETLDEAIEFANRYAPEHTSVMTENALEDARRITTSGTTFVGHSASVAFGDYLTGANHVLPTGGRARSFSGLSTHHFLRSFTLQEIDGAGADSLAKDVAVLARAEGLPGHAAAALARRLS